MEIFVIICAVLAIAIGIAAHSSYKAKKEKIDKNHYAKQKARKLDKG